MTEPIQKIYIVEDDEPTRRRLVTMTQSHLQLSVAGEAGDLATANADWSVLCSCAAVLVDLALPDGDGATLIHALSQEPSPPSVLVISVFGDEQRVIRAIQAGAAGYLLKDSDERTLADGILQTIRGESPISPSIARHLLKHFQQPPSSEKTSPITQRETEVLTLIARGYSNTEIAELLEMSGNTVSTHTKHIYRKLAVNSRGEAVFEATQLGLIDLSPPQA